MAGRRSSRRDLQHAVRVHRDPEREEREGVGHRMGPGPRRGLQHVKAEGPLGCRRVEAGLGWERLRARQGAGPGRERSRTRDSHRPGAFGLWMDGRPRHPALAASQHNTRAHRGAAHPAPSSHLHERRLQRGGDVPGLYLGPPPLGLVAPLGSFPAAREGGKRWGREAAEEGGKQLSHEGVQTGNGCAPPPSPSSEEMTSAHFSSRGGPHPARR